MADQPTPPSPESAHVRELGVAATTSLSWAQFDTEESNPELRWPECIAVYDAMRRTDATCAAVLRAITLPLRRTPWRIDPAGASDDVTELVAQDLGLPIKGRTQTAPRRRRDRFSWDEHLQLALLSLVYGHMFFEQVYRIDENGYARLRKLGPRHPRTIAEIKVAKDGGLEGIKQYQLGTDAGQTGRLIKVDDLVAYVNDREGANWRGTSLLRPAYKHWLMKDRLLRVQAQTIERNGMGVPRYTAAERETSLTEGKALAAAWRSGESAGASIPYGAKLDLVGVSGELPDADKPIRYHDEKIHQSVLQHFANLGAAQGTGSYALGSTFMDFFAMSLQAVADQIADVATAHIVEDLVDLNYGSAEPAPRVVCDRIGAQSDVTALAVKTLIEAGALSPDAGLEAYLRTKFQLPDQTDAAPAAPPPTTEGTDQ